VLSDADRAGGHLQDGGGLLGGQTAGDAQQQELAVLGGQLSEQGARPVRIGRGQRVVFGPGAVSARSGSKAVGMPTWRAAVRCTSAILWLAMPKTKAAKGRP